MATQSGSAPPPGTGRGDPDPTPRARWCTPSTFYFILYLVIALTALNVVDYTANSRFRLVAWRGNLAARLLYRPITMALVPAATVGVFLL